MAEEGRNDTPTNTGEEVGVVAAERRKITVARLWKGEVDLRVTFWGFGFLVSLGLQLLGSLLTSLSPGVSSLAGAIAVVALGILGIVELGYLLFISVAIWRSAGHYRGERIWAVLARTVVVVRLAGAAATALREFVYINAEGT